MAQEGASTSQSGSKGDLISKLDPSTRNIVKDILGEERVLRPENPEIVPPKDTVTYKIPLANGQFLFLQQRTDGRWAQRGFYIGVGKDAKSQRFKINVVTDEFGVNVLVIADTEDP